MRAVCSVLLFFLLVLAPPPAHAQPAPQNMLLRVILPEDGTGGLEAGAEVQVLGLRAGTIRRIAFAPQRRLLAEVLIEQPEARDFIRRDSPVFIRTRLSGMGAAYLFIGRGDGAPLDWSAAEVEAGVEPSQTAAVLGLLEQIRDRAFPVLDDVGRLTRFAARFVEAAERGEGSIGRLLTDDRFARSAEDTARELAVLVQGGTQLMQRLDTLAVEAQRLLADQGGAGGSLPALVRRVDQALANLERTTRDISRASARLPQTVRNVEDTTGSLPGLLLQTQQTTRELELLLAQLRGTWLLGGGGPPPPEPRRPSAERLRP